MGIPRGTTAINRQTGPRLAAETAGRHTAKVAYGVEMMFTRDLRDQVARGEVTVSIRLWSRPKVRVGGRYRTAGVIIEIDSLELMPFSAVTEDDVAASGESDREALRARAAHSGPIDDNTLVHRVEFHRVSS